MSYTGIMKSLRILLVLLLLPVMACGGELQKISDSKLRHKAFECRNKKMSRTKAVMCDQVKRECSRRDMTC